MASRTDSGILCTQLLTQWATAEYRGGMKITGIRELRAQSAALLGGDEPLLVTKHGRISGLYLPLEEPDKIPDDLRRELASVLGQHLSKLIAR